MAKWKDDNGAPRVSEIREMEKNEVWDGLVRWAVDGESWARAILAQQPISPFSYSILFSIFIFGFISNYKFEFDSNFTLIFKCIIKIPA